MTERFQSDLEVKEDPEVEKAYLSTLDETLSHLMSKPSPTLESIVTRARGAFPTLVRERLRYLGLDDKLLSAHSQPSLPSSVRGPELHPLDFEWYFTSECAQYLAEVLADDKGEILCMGAPTVASAIAGRGGKALLLDNNLLIRQRLPATADSLKFLHCDLHEQLPVTTNFPIVFFDAPWYPEPALLWLWQASQVVRQGGLIAFSLFPPLLRSKAEYERHQILDQVVAMGDVKVEEECLLYETPLFEQEALSRCGIKLTTNWRRGDLVLIRIGRKSHLPRPQIVENLSELWDSYVLGRQVVKLRQFDEVDASMILSPVDGCSDFVYPTVSLRDSRRSVIDLWTSRNRVARVGSRKLVASILSQLDRGISLQAIMRSTEVWSLNEKDREGLLNSLKIILNEHQKEGNHAAPYNCS